MSWAAKHEARLRRRLIALHHANKDVPDAPQALQMLARIFAIVADDPAGVSPAFLRFNYASPRFQKTLGGVVGLVDVLLMLGYEDHGDRLSVSRETAREVMSSAATLFRLSVEQLEEVVEEDWTVVDEAEEEEEEEVKVDSEEEEEEQVRPRQQDDVAVLVGMGFKERAAVLALKATSGVVPRAVSYLMTMQDDDDDDEEVQPHETPREEVELDEETQRLIEQLEREEEERRQKQREADEAATAALIRQLQEQAKEEEVMRRTRLKRQLSDDRHAVKAYLQERLVNGHRLSRQEYNYLLAPEGHTEDSRYECGVCFGDDLNLDEIVMLDDGHYYCLDCTRHQFQSQIDSGRSSDMICPHPDCKRLINFGEVERVVDERTLERYQQFLLDAHLRMDPDCRWCPRPGCETAMIGNADNPMMVCPNERCRYTMCFNCKVEWHADATCEAYQQWKEENAHAGERFERWAAKNTKPCPRCKAPIEKRGGCNHITATCCGYEFCWLCAEPYKSGHYALDESHPCYGKQFA